jgi:hypothetical protein
MNEEKVEAAKEYINTSDMVTERGKQHITNLIEITEESQKELKTARILNAAAMHIMTREQLKRLESVMAERDKRLKGEKG